MNLVRLLVSLAPLLVLLVLSPIGARAQDAPIATIQAEVTGHPAPGWFVARAVERAVRQSLPAHDLSLTVTPLPADLQPGAEALVTVRVTRGGAAVPPAPLAVHVRNRPSLCQRASLLFVSNSPETLRFATGLFRGTLGSGETVRLLIHHRNGMAGQPMLVRVQVANPSRQAAQIWVNDASATPTRDELLAGHLATGRWLRQHWNCAAQSLEVPPNSTLTLDAFTLAPNEVASGVLQVWLRQGERVVLFVHTGAIEPAQESFLINKDTTHVRGTFASPVRELQVAHEAGEVNLITVGGGDRAEETSSGAPLRGNYGVIYNVRGILVNRSPEPRRVAVRAVAAGGVARGTFLLNGQVLETGLLRTGQPVTLSVLTVPASGRLPFFLSTMPQSGSAYPVRVTLGPP